jgi:hypothetical protein
MTTDEYEAEIRRLNQFILAVSERLYLAAEVLSILAERKERKNVSTTAHLPHLEVPRTPA